MVSMLALALVALALALALALSLVLGSVVLYYFPCQEEL
jgi:hypothetical protein